MWWTSLVVAWAVTHVRVRPVLWTDVTHTVDDPSRSCYLATNGTWWCVDDATLLAGVDLDDSY